MAEVFLAFDSNLQRPAVVKRLLPHLSKREGYVEMFLEESRVGARLHHPNICEIYTTGQSRGEPYIVFEYLEGATVREILQRTLTIDRSPALAATIIAQACLGLQAAHELTDEDGRPLGLVHRDISPDNIFVTTDGCVKILDFGIAKIDNAKNKTKTGILKGKPCYMCPEQLEGRAVDARADLFSASIVLTELITGEPLFKRETDFMTFKAITEEMVPDIRHRRPEVSEELAATISRGLCKYRDGRFESAAALAEALRESAASVPSAALGSWVSGNFEEKLAKQRKKIEQWNALENTGTTDLRKPLLLETMAGEDDADTLEPAKTPVGQPAPAPSPAVFEPPPEAFSTAGSVTETGRSASPGSNRKLVWIGFAALAATALGLVALGLKPPPTEDQAAVAEVVPVAPSEPAEVEAPVPVAEEEPAKSVEPVPAAAKQEEPVPAVEPTEVEPAEPVAKPAAVAEPAPKPKTEPTSKPKTEDRKPKPKTASRPGRLTIDSFPYATIYIDGKKKGLTPLAKLSLSPGTHTIRAVRADGKSKTMTIRIRSGKALRKRISW